MLPWTGCATPAASRRDAGSGPIILGAPGGVIPVPATTYRATESKLGRKLAAIRMYAHWDTPFPDATSTWARNGGRLVLLSVQSGTMHGAVVPYRDIAAAAPGAPVYGAIVRWANAVKAFRAPIFFTFNHEPEGVRSDRNGTAQEYIAAWRRIVDVFRQQAVRNARYMFIATAHGFGPDSARQAARYYPGDAYIDAIGADAYNWYTCRAGVVNGWRSLANLIEPLRQFGALHPTKAIWLPEFGSAEDPASPGRKAGWVAQAEALFRQPAYAAFKGVLIWYGASGPGICGFRVDSTRSALQSYRSLAADPYYAASP
jgi:Glycosyl hydrolase family 26